MFLKRKEKLWDVSPVSVISADVSENHSLIPGFEDEMGLCIWKDGHVDSGSMRSICDCFAR